MTKERFSNLTVLNSHKERTAKFAPNPRPLHFKRGGIGPQVRHFETPKSFGKVHFHEE